MLTWCGVPYSPHGYRPDSLSRASEVAILGAPLDDFSSRHSGQADAPGAIRRHETFDSWVDPMNGVDLRAAVNVVDCGDVEAYPPYPVNAYEDLMNRAYDIGRNTGTLVTIGGDHTVSAYVLDGLKKIDKTPIALVHLDAHTDTWGDHYTSATVDMPHHGSWIRWVVDEGIVDRVYQYGIRTLGPPDDGDLRERSTFLRFNMDADNAFSNADFYLDQLNETHRVYLSIDLDVVDPAFAPGVAYREPGGWSSAELLRGVEVFVAKYKPIGVDIVECIPDRDRDGLTVGLAHRLILSVIKGRALAKRVEGASTN